MIPDSDINVERITGQGPGGQHRNKTASCVRVTHIPTGIQVTIDGRHQHKNLRVAKKELEARVAQAAAGKRAAKKKARRDRAVKDTPTIRTYDLRKGVVKDHRSKKTASVKDVLGKGKLELLR